MFKEPRGKKKAVL